MKTKEIKTFEELVEECKNIKLTVNDSIDERIVIIINDKAFWIFKSEEKDKIRRCEIRQLGVEGSVDLHVKTINGIFEIMKTIKEYEN